MEIIICNFYGEDVSEAKTLIHQHYETVIRPRPGRQNCGTKTLKQKEMSDILDAMNKIDESGPQRHVIFVAINLINLPPISQTEQVSTTIPMNLAHNVSNLETLFQRLPPARGGTAQRKILHLANWSQLIHPGPASSMTKFFLVSSQSCVSTLPP